MTVLYPSKEARDATIASGMERGVAASYDRLEDLVRAEIRFTHTHKFEPASPGVARNAQWESGEQLT